MPCWHHHCGCPYHHSGRACPWCDEPGHWPRRDPSWDESSRPGTELSSREIERLRDAVEQLSARLDALEAE